MQSGDGWNPSWPPPLERLSRFRGNAASASPSSSSLANGPRVEHHQQQQHIADWQELQQGQNQLRMHGSTFLSSSDSMHSPQLPWGLRDLTGASQQLHEENLVPYGPTFNQDTSIISRNDLFMQQESKEMQDNRGVGHSSAANNYLKVENLPSSAASMNQNLDYSDTRNNFDVNQMSHAQYFRSSNLSNQTILNGSSLSSQGLPQVDHQQQAQLIGFTKEQMLALKAQILAFRCLKRRQPIPSEVLHIILDPPCNFWPQQSFAGPHTINQGQESEEQSTHGESSNWIYQASSIKDQNLINGEPIHGEEKVAMLSQTRGMEVLFKEPVPAGPDANLSNTFEPNQQAIRRYRDDHIKEDSSNIKGKAAWVAVHGRQTVGTSEVMKLLMPNSAAVSRDDTTRKYTGSFPYLASSREEHNSLRSTANYRSNFGFEYGARNLLFEESKTVSNKKRTENSKGSDKLLEENLEKKMIRPDLKQLQIEEKKSEPSYLQSGLKNVVDQQQQEVRNVTGRPYQKFVQQYQSQRIGSSRQVQQPKKVFNQKQMKSIFRWRKDLSRTHSAIRNARTIKNKGVIKCHERMLREFSKKNKAKNKGLQSLKNNNADRHHMSPKQQTDTPDDASERCKFLSWFLHQTEEYLQKLGRKISAARNQQEAAKYVVAAACAQGLSEEGKGTAASAGQELIIRSTPEDSASANKYYNLAHAVTERVVRQPSMLRVGTLRDYQLVGLQWMLSLYNNKLNGILADEMGLGKTVQVMALIAYLMEFKENYGPHLIIVPNAVLFNWKSELLNWLPSVSCIFYVGTKDQRSKLFMQEVSAVKFNVLVTTYEYVMKDRSKLSKIYWKYIIVDEAQRMKDRESILARDLDKYKCQRRLLLTGTPLQNDLKELWSLLNLLLPEIFDSQKEFNDWFSKVFRRDGPCHNPEEDRLETEKKVAIIHRLHQILEPFMLRRRVQDVEGSLPPKVPIVLRCRMSALQSAIYNWIKSTGTIRVDPEDEMLRLQKNPMYQAKTYKDLKNKCMELRKVCNHPLLNYPSLGDEHSVDFVVRSCGKLWVLDRILLKLQRSGHRVLLFSTMTKLLDILEDYLVWRKLVYRRIDGMTSLQDRESAILDFNGCNSDCFIFLLSIRAAGRGLNLQSADTVIIYDPDPNPQNEEQAVARSHRIGQTKEVKVIYMEAVVDKSFSFQEEDHKNGGAVNSGANLFVQESYMGSVESLVRKNIQQHKIEMTEEAINAGRFDQRTTHEERRMTLESLLHDEERYQVTAHEVPSMQEINRMIARGDEEIQLFDQMDQDFDWAAEMVGYVEVPKWLLATSKQVHEAAARISSCEQPKQFGRRKNRPRCTSTYMDPIYKELDDEDGEDSGSSSEEWSGWEGTEVGESEDEENINDIIDLLPRNKDHIEEEKLVDDDSCNEHAGQQSSRDYHLIQESGMSGSFSTSHQWSQLFAPSVSSQLVLRSSLEATPVPLATMKGLNHEGKEERTLQPKVKGKRSTCSTPRNTAEKVENGSSSERMFSHTYSTKNMYRNGNLLARNVTSSEHSKESRISRTTNSGGINSIESKMSDSMQRKCKNVTSKLQSRIDKEGDQILPHLSDWWRKHKDSGSVSPDEKSSSFLNLHKIEQRLSSLKYNSLTDFIGDVQLMLNNFVRYSETLSEINVVRPESAKFEDMFFGMMEAAFPDVDFGEARSTVLHSTNVSMGMIYNTDAALSKTLKGQITAGHDVKGASLESMHGKESEPAVGSGQKRPGHSNQLSHLQRKDKSELKRRMNRNGAQTLSQENSTVPVKRPRKGDGENRSHGVGYTQCTAPVKRKRTDSGKRRPRSHVISI